MQDGEEDEQNPEDDENKTIDAIEIEAEEEEEDDESHRRTRLEIQKSAEIANREKSADKRRRKT